MAMSLFLVWDEWVVCKWWWWFCSSGDDDDRLR